MVWGFNPGKNKRLSSFSKCPDWLWGPPNLLFNGYWGSFMVGKQLGCEVEHSPP